MKTDKIKMIIKEGYKIKMFFTTFPTEPTLLKRSKVYSNRPATISGV